MPSLREKVTTYFRQLSFIADPRESGGGHGNRSTRKHDEGNFITKYLEGSMERVFIPGPDIKSGQAPNDLPDLQLAFYPTGPNTITAACTGPDEGLTGIKRSKLHLSAGSDIDFIDTNQDQEEFEIRQSTNLTGSSSNLKLKQQQLLRYRSDQNANKTASVRSRKNLSRTGSTETNQQQEQQTKTDLSLSISSSSSAVKDGNDDNKKIETLSTSITSIKQIENIIEGSLIEKTTATTTKILTNEVGIDNEPIAGVSNWKMETDHAYGISISLYEYNMVTKEPTGNPIADCYGIVVRGNCAAMALADGVNWGDGARLAARSAVHGSLDYLDTAIFGVAQECKATSTRDVFISLLRSFWEAHDCILEVGGALSTLTVAVVLPLGAQNTGRYVVCSCNVGDSLGYIYSKKHGVRELTQESHDITSMRDMRDALGALGPADGNKPELGNLTLSMTIVDSGDIVFLTSDGISDNFDPVVGRFAEAWTPNSRIKMQQQDHHHNHTNQLAPKKQNKSTSALPARLSKESKPSSSAAASTVDASLNKIQQQQQQQKILSSNISNSNSGSSNIIPNRPPRNKRVQENVSNTISTTSTTASLNRPKYMRSHTVIETRGGTGGNNRNHRHYQQHQHIIKFPRSAAGLPLVTGPQRHALTLLRLEDLLSYGINGSLRPCPSARKLCHLLVDFVKMITSARRKTLEQRELFYKLVTDHDGVRKEIEMNRMQHRATRKRIVDSNAFSLLPGKLDHATVVAFTIGSGLQTAEFQETNF